MSESIPINRWWEKKQKNSTTKFKKKKKKRKKKNGSGEHPGENWSYGRSHAKLRLNPCATATKTISYFKLSQPLFRKIRKTKQISTNLTSTLSGGMNSKYVLK